MSFWDELTIQNRRSGQFQDAEEIIRALLRVFEDARIEPAVVAAILRRAAAEVDDPSVSERVTRGTGARGGSPLPEKRRYRVHIPELGR